MSRSHRCARMQAATLTITWLAYYDFACVYVANMQTSLKSLLAFVHERCEKRFLPINAIHLCTPHGYSNTDVFGKLTEINGAASCTYSSSLPV